MYPTKPKGTVTMIANMIFMKFANNPEGFKNSFGFDMYETFNGRKVLNYRLLIADMFV